MVDTEKMRGLLARLTAGEQLTAREIGTFVDAADEIDAGRNTRLAQYRCAALGGLLADTDIAKSFYAKDRPGVTLAMWIAEEAENYVHAMLAAERTPEVKP